MANVLQEFRTEFKIRRSKSLPFFYGFITEYSIMCGIKLNSIKLGHIYIKEILFLGLWRVNPANPFFSSPFCAADINLSFGFLLLQLCKNNIRVVMSIRESKVYVA